MYPFFIAGIVSLVTPTFAEEPNLFPTLEAETLLGKDLKIPQDFATSFTWITIGFSKDSQKSTQNCADLLEQNFKDKGYSAAILQGAPFFIKGVIKNKIRSSVPEQRRGRYLILNEGRDELKKLAHYSENKPDDAYIIGISQTEAKTYSVAFRSSGVCDSSHLTTLTQLIRENLPKSQKAPKPSKNSN